MSVIIGLSGGVDSAVSALLLTQQGVDVSAMFMKNWEGEGCDAEDDLHDARLVAQKLGITLHERNFAAEYWDNVFEHFLAEHRAGRTPNPDVLCNREIKFKTFLKHAQDLGASEIATGHYCRRGEQDGRYQLLKGLDENKDQSYFLHALSQHQLACTRFPVGEIPKDQVRELAQQHGLHVFDKKDSTGICFIGERNFSDFLAQFIPPQPGEIRSVDGDVLGEHQGLMFYTLGQRRGIGVGGHSSGSGEPWFAVHKDLERNILFVGQGVDHPLLFSTELTGIETSWISGDAPSGSFSCKAKTRYRQPDQSCEVRVEGDRVHVSFEQPQRAVTPGQSVVFYQGDVCLGGAVIDSTNAAVDAL